MSEIKLLPCPFCGGKAVVLSYDNGFNNWFQVVCKECNVSQTGSNNWTKNNAIEQWNTRKPMERIVEQIDDLETYYDNGDFATCGDRLVVLKDVLQIVKEEGGIDAE